MALRLRRGLDTERQSVIFAEGEPIFTTDTKKIHIGDGSTPGGLLVSGLLSLNDDPTPRLGGNLDLNANDIVGIGNLNIVGDISITGSFTAGFIEADYRGSLFANDSSVIVDGNAKALHGSLKADTGETMFDASQASFNLNNNKLSDFGDVIAAASVGEFLTWDGVVWEGKPFGGQLDGTPPPNYSLVQYQDGTGWIGNTIVYDASAETMLDTSTGYVNITKQFINELSNVAIDDVSLAPDDILTWDGLNWTHKQLAPVNFNMTLGELDDVFTTGMDFSHIIKWDGTTWINDKLELEELKNVAIASINPEETIIWDGANWVNGKFTLAQLDNVLAASPNIGETLVWNGTDWKSDRLVLTSLSDIAIDPSTLNVKDLLGYDGSQWVPTTLSMNELNDVLLSTPAIGDILIYDGSNFVNQPSSINLETYQGDVLSLDSTLIIDSSTNKITANQINCTNFEADHPTSDAGFFFERKANLYGGRSKLNVIRSINTADNGICGSLEFSDIINGVQKRYSALLASPERTLFFNSYSGDTADEIAAVTFYNDPAAAASEWGKVGLGTFDPEEKLHVVGNAKVDGFVQFGPLTTTERDAMTASNGMVIYNTTANKFQGYANNVWVDLH